MRLIHKVAIATATAIVAAAVASPAEASHVDCGDELNSDTTLDNDLVNCSGNGLVIGGDDITVDLNGHLLDGDAAEDQSCVKGEICDVGIVLEGHDGVTITDGSIREFGLGALVIGGSGNFLTRLRAVHNTFSGMVVAGSDRATLRHDRFGANGLETDQAGIGVFDTSGLRMAESELIGNGDIGLYGENNVEGEIVRNRVSGNPEAGILIDGARMRFIRNRVTRNGDGIVASGAHNSISRNVVRYSRSCGNGCGIGISIEGGSGHRIIGNRVKGVDAIGIRVAGYDSVKHVRIARNKVRGAGGDGFSVRSVLAPVADIVVRRNRARGAGGDGIDVSVGSAKLGHNVANRNGDLGMEAQAGATDTGGNRARGNRDARQCVNVDCA